MMDVTMLFHDPRFYVLKLLKLEALIHFDCVEGCLFAVLREGDSVSEGQR